MSDPPEWRIACVADAAGVACSISASDGDPALIPTRRSYIFQIRTPRRPRAVEIDGLGAIAEGAPEGPAWWHDGERFMFVRAPQAPVTARIVL